MESSFSNRQFWRVFEICLSRLSKNTARVFMMREMLGFDTKEICKELAISSTNCWVSTAPCSDGVATSDGVAACLTSMSGGLIPSIGMLNCNQAHRGCCSAPGD